MEAKPDFSSLKESLPPIVPRNEIERYLGSCISRGYLQNLDSLGKGPKRIKLGQKICYLREDLIEWLEERAEVCA